jgi:hypothetical protein
MSAANCHDLVLPAPSADDFSNRGADGAARILRVGFLAFSVERVGMEPLHANPIVFGNDLVQLVDASGYSLDAGFRFINPTRSAIFTYPKLARCQGFELPL